MLSPVRLLVALSFVIGLLLWLAAPGDVLAQVCNGPVYCAPTACGVATNVCACSATICTGPLVSYDAESPARCGNGCPGNTPVTCTPGNPGPGNPNPPPVCRCSCSTCNADTRSFSCSLTGSPYCIIPCTPGQTPPPGANPTPTSAPPVCVPGTCSCAGSLSGGPGLACVPNASCPAGAACCTSDNPPGCADGDISLGSVRLSAKIQPHHSVLVLVSHIESRLLEVGA